MYVMMPDMMGMGWVMGVVWLFALVLVILGIAVLAKYLFSKPRR
jgi:hypothetical protein